MSPYYAIRDVTVLTGTGEKLEQATVVIADGLIEAVGPGVEIPADAWVLDGEGLELYPGLIDALTNLGQVEAEETPSGAGAGRGEPVAHRHHQHRGPLDRSRPRCDAAALPLRTLLPQ